MHSFVDSSALISPKVHLPKSIMDYIYLQYCIREDPPTMPCKDCERTMTLLKEFQENFKEIAVLHSMVEQLRQSIHLEMCADDPYVELVSILPYSLYPSMLSE